MIVVLKVGRKFREAVCGSVSPKLAKHSQR